MQNIVPVVVENTGGIERSFDIYSRLLRERIIFVTGEIETNMAATICAQLLFLEAENPEAPIYMYINSGGGSVDAGLSITSTMDFVSCPIITVSIGMVASMGSFIAMRGETRYILADTRTMIHSVSTSTGYQTIHDLDIRIEEAKRLNNLLTQHYADRCGGTFEEWHNRMKRDKYLTPEEAVDLCLADKVIKNRADIE